MTISTSSGPPVGHDIGAAAGASAFESFADAGPSPSASALPGASALGSLALAGVLAGGDLAAQMTNGDLAAAAT